MIEVKVRAWTFGHVRPAPKEIAMTPFLALVLAGYALFIVVLGGGWLLDVRHDAQLKKQSTR